MGEIFVTRYEVRQYEFNYIKLIYNTKRKHGKNEMLTPVD